MFVGRKGDYRELSGSVSFQQQFKHRAVLFGLSDF